MAVLAHTFHKSLNVKGGGHPSAGLSLVEVLVTLAIIAVATSLIVITARPTDPGLLEAERLNTTIQSMAERTRVAGQPSGIFITGSTYSPALWRDGEWQPIAGQQRRLPAGIRLEHVERLPAPDEAIPDVIFDPLGHSRRVELILWQGSVSSRITISESGLSLSEPQR